MKSLISVTPHEFKRHFDEIMNMCTDMCVTTNQEIIIVIPEKKNSQTYAEVANVFPADGGVKYDYHYELLKKFGINTNNRMNKIENIITDAFEKSGIAECIRNNKEATDKLHSATVIAAKKLVKQFGL